MSGQAAEPKPSLAVVLPALNEAARLPVALASVAAQDEPVDVVVVDGGSTDGTPDVARRHGARVVTAPRGRACQLNAGAAATAAARLLFLHADTRLPAGAFAALHRALDDPAVAGGCFRLTFDGDRPDGPLARQLMRLWESERWMSRLPFAFGDRAQFCSRAAWTAAGGYPEQPIFEDLDFAEALAARGRFVFLDAAVATSARRFRERGALRQQLRNGALLLARKAGVSPETCKRFYPDSGR